MRRFAVPVAAALSLFVAGCATPSSGPAPVAQIPAPKGPPQLIVALSVDQLSADLFAQYRSRFTGGLARLEQGAVFPSGYQAHAATETCPGHATLLTGTRPARSGIIANNWFDLGTARAEKKIYCAEDESDPASSTREPVVSAVHLKVPTLGDLMKAANPASRNVAVSAKDRSVIMMGGHRIDAAWWYNKGQFVTLRGRSASPAITQVNAKVAALIAAGAPAMAMPDWCAPADRPVAVGKGQLGTGRFALAADKADAFRASPRMDAATVDLATALVDEMNLGQGTAAPDILSVSLSATDYIGHSTGTEGGEMCVQMAELDRVIGRLLAHLDARGIDYAVVLSADHGGLDMPERQREQALPSAIRADMSLAPQALAKAITEQTGIATADPLLSSDGLFGDFYLSRSLTADQKAKAMAALVKIATAHPQVAAAFTAAELARTPLPAGSPQDFTLKERARASFDPARSGDVVILLDRAVTPIPEPVGSYVSTHGSPWDYDRRVPMLFWRKGLRGFEQPAPVETIDIAPTLAAVLGLAVQEGAFDGRCLDIDGGPGNTCAAIK